MPDNSVSSLLVLPGTTFMLYGDIAYGVCNSPAVCGHKYSRFPDSSSRNLIQIGALLAGSSLVRRTCMCVGVAFVVHDWLITTFCLIADR